MSDHCFRRGMMRGWSATNRSSVIDISGMADYAKKLGVHHRDTESTEGREGDT